MIIGFVLLCSEKTALSAQASSQLQKSSVNFVVTDCWGGPIREASIQLVGRNGTQTVVNYPESHSIEIVPGSYNMNIQARGFSKFVKTVDLEGRASVVASCLTVSPIEGTRELSSMVIGRVARPIPAHGFVWVRLVGIYSDISTATIVDKSGSFVFSAIRLGRYYLMMFGANGLVSSQEVDVRVGQTKISIE